MKNKIRVIIIYCLLITALTHAQSIDLQSFKKANLKVSGGINANTVFYNSNATVQSRKLLNYLLSGSLNFNAFNFSMPLSYTITNQGKNLGYQLPFNFNKFSIAPKYKWIKTYIGDANMTFSPYTLSGHPFRGAGIELTPRGSLKLSLMGGQLLKKIALDTNQIGVPVLERMGYGTKINFEKTAYKLTLIQFFAKDKINSQQNSYDFFGITPKQNSVTSLETQAKLAQNFEINLEYAISILTNDTRVKKTNNSLLNQWLNINTTSSTMHAFKSNINYNIQKTKLGLNYERIDPNYKTLGALYFNNDLENIAITFSRSFWNEKINLSANLGYQHNNIKAQKKEITKRNVGGFDLNYNATENLKFSVFYSNLSTYTNKNLNQFSQINNEYINPADTLNYKQLSQNGTLNTKYTFGQNKNQNLNLNYNIAQQANEQAKIIRAGQLSTVQNLALNHDISFKESKILINSSLNYTTNYVNRQTNYAKGASVGMNKKIINDLINTNISFLYNDNKNNNITDAVYGVKFNANCTLYKKHQLNISTVQMLRKSNNNTLNEVTATLNYNYSF